MPKPAAQPDARQKLLDAAVSVIRTKGYSATTVDELCASAGVTKGAFFHHFKSKDALGVAAAEHWSDTTGALFAEAKYHEAFRSARSRPRLPRASQEAVEGRSERVHLSRRNDGAGELRDLSGHPRRV